MTAPDHEDLAAVFGRRVAKPLTGCALFVLIPLGFALVMSALLESLRMGPAGLRPPWVDYLLLVCMIGVYLIVLAWVFRVIGRRRTVFGGHVDQNDPLHPSRPLIRFYIAVFIALSAYAMFGPAAIGISEPQEATLALDSVEVGVSLVAGGLFLAVGGGIYWLLSSRAPDSDATVLAERPIPPPPAPRTCPKCGSLIPAGAAQGLCPRCLLQGVMPGEGRPSPTLAFIEAYVAPPVEDVQKQFPHLQIIRLIGQGGMGAVYLARQPGLDRLVALKLVRPHDDPTFTERFVREAKAMARLSHPNIVTVYESGEVGGLPYLVMEYMDGLTLRDAIRERKLTPAEALAVVPQICDALEYAHSQGVVHRDIKPENILLSAETRGADSKNETTSHSSPRSSRFAIVKIADFGLAKLTDPAAVSLTRTQQAMGTPHYMAPEQWEKPNEVDHRADLYALGVVLYELLTGELPLGRFEPPSRKVTLDLRIDDVVLRALAKEPGNRYQHASDIRIALEAVASGSEVPGWVRTPLFSEYRSKRSFLGWPLVHITSGIDPRTGLAKTARGWLAIGSSSAVGGLAIAGGFARGIFALAGGGALGLFALAGGISIGLVAVAGGAAAGLLAAGAGGAAAAGGFAIAGGFAAAVQFAFAGGDAAANWVYSSQRQDPGFWQQFWDWLKVWESDVH